MMIQDSDILVSEAKEAVEQRHTHTNKSTLEKLGEIDGQLTYDGNFIHEEKSVLDSASYINPNLLHNWDFRQSPVNQRGQTEYTGSGIYTIDRFVTVLQTTLEIHAGFLRIIGNQIQQQLEPNIREAITGKTVTISALLADGRLISASGVVGSHAGTYITAYVPGSQQRIALHRSVNAINLGVYIQNVNSEIPLEVQAVKLEMGSVSTLANDPPMDYGRELAICQRFQQIRSTNNINILDLRPSMRINPVITAFTGGGFMYDANI